MSKVLFAKLILLFSLSVLFVGILESQVVSPEIIANIKKSTVYLKVKHQIPLTQEDYTTTGTGFFISGNGYIVTNYHVVSSVLPVYNWYFPAPITEIKVYQYSGSIKYKTYKAIISAVDKENDIAILAITDTISVLHLKISDNDSLIESQAIWAFGYPFGETFSVLQRGPEITVSNGIITALRHDDTGERTSIQINASINPGNSGGPLIDKNGDVIGIINMAGKSNMNFAVPVHYLRNLIEKSDTLKISQSIQLCFESSVQGSDVFIDSLHIGKTPVKNYKMSPGLHTIIISKEGYENYIENICLTNNDTINGNLEKIDIIDIKTIKADIADLKFKESDFVLSDTLFYESFNDSEKLNNWEQNTGGVEKRTWFIEDGILNQYESNSVLHAIYMGNENWSDYLIRSKVKIIDNHDDSRAGIIFRESSKGFYLFRIHKETKKAQLAYHSKHPFGWFIIKEQTLDADIKNNWNELSVYCIKNQIFCFFNSKCILSANAEYSKNGKIGFYSVQSKAAFDDVSIHKITSSDIDTKLDNSLLSFWFSDYFNFDSKWWALNSFESSCSDGWIFSDFGCFQSKTDNKLRALRFSKYKFDNFIIRLNISFGDNEDKDLFEIFFRENNGKAYVVSISKDDKTIELIEKDTDSSKILKKENIPLSFFKKAFTMYLSVNKDKISLFNSSDIFFEYKGKKMNKNPGFLGFNVLNQTIVLHDITISSPRNDE